MVCFEKVVRFVPLSVGISVSWEASFGKVFAFTNLVQADGFSKKLVQANGFSENPFGRRNMSYLTRCM